MSDPLFLVVSLLFSRLYSFFFSSRRRHTRWPRDWSSDVCSSDLCDASVRAVAGLADSAIVLVLMSPSFRAELPLVPEGIGLAARSEERRVGKECRSRWSAYH